jgi:glyoxylase-like metal-dependent hydrolase (beta-lactamase superfamily II)
MQQSPAQTTAASTNAYVTKIMQQPVINTLQVGDVHITGLSDGSITFNPRVLFPQTALDAWAPYYDRFPEYFEGHLFRNNLGSFVFTSDGHSVLADSGFGPLGEMLGHPAPGELIDDLTRNGITPGAIDTVFLTHLHGDHVGWNLREDLPDRPLSFPSARYRVHEADWNHYTSQAALDSPVGEIIKRSVLPLEERGVLELMDAETELAKGITAFPTPGHTPGHMSLLIASNNERAILVGDIFGSPMHVSETELHYTPDWDKQMGIQARHTILDQAERGNATVIGSHLSYPGWGSIIRWRGRRYWKAIQSHQASQTK